MKLSTAVAGGLFLWSLGCCSLVRAQPAPEIDPADPAFSEEPAEAQAPQGFRAGLDIRVQPEAWDFFPAGTAENRYLLAGIRSRLHLHYQTEDFHARLELQDVQLGGLPSRAVAPSPAGSLGSGGSYYGLAGSDQINSVGVRKAYLRFGKRDFNAFQIGRFDYYSGQEIPCRDPILDWMKRERVSKKLVGCPDYNTWSRTFDGLRLDLDDDRFHLTGAVLRPTQVSPQFNQNLPDLLVSNLSVTLKENTLLPDAEAQFFWNRYSDDRPVPQVDNRPGRRPTIQADGGNLVDTLGFHYLARLGRDGDFLLWAAHQSGRWGSLRQDAWGASIEAGLRFPEVWGEPWVRAGLSIYSGDKNPRDGVHGTFMAPVPDNRVRFPLYTLANVRDPKIQFMLKPLESTRLRADFHWLSLDSPDDLWYQGSGATTQTGPNGYSSRPSGGSTDLGKLLEIWLEQQLDPNQKLVFHYGRAWGGQVVGASFEQRTGQVFYTEYRLSLP